MKQKFHDIAGKFINLEHISWVSDVGGDPAWKRYDIWLSGTRLEILECDFKRDKLIELLKEV